jgi:hypothetical protein
MEERVARAIEKSWLGASQDDPPSSIDMARAAIRAMREPTADMNNAGDDHSVVPANIWRVMIDEASPSSEVRDG